MKSCNHCLKTRVFDYKDDIIRVCKEYDECVNDNEEYAEECDYYKSDSDEEEN